jgi:hypothetical protein
MTIVEQILETYPELSDFECFRDNTIIVQDDSDGVGAYIAKWEYTKPIPNGLSLGKP